MCACIGAPVVFDDNEEDRNRLSSELSLLPQTHGSLQHGHNVCVLAHACAFVADKRPEFPTRCCFNEINQKDGKSKHFVLCDNKMSFCFPAIIGCFLIQDYCSVILLVHNGVLA